MSVEAERIFVRVDAITSGLTAGLAGAQGKLKGFATAAESTGRTLTTHLTLPILAFTGYVGKSAVDFQSKMRLIQTSAGGSAKDVKVLSAQILALGGKVAQGPMELADAMYHLKSLGLDNAKAMVALKIAAQGAQMGHANLESTVNALGGAIRTGIKGAQDYSQAMAIMNATVGAGNMRMDDLTAAFGTGLPPAAKIAGVSLQQMGAALATMTDENMPAEQAATRLRMSLALMAAPSKAANKALGEIGLTGSQLGEALQGPGGLIAALQLIKDHLSQAGDKAQQFAVLSHAFGGGRSSGAIMLMVNNLDVLKRKYDQIGATAGNFASNLAASNQTTAVKVEKAWGGIQSSLIQVGSMLLPGIASKFQRLAQVVQEAVQWFNNLSSSGQRMVGFGALALAGLGPVVSMLGRIVTAIRGTILGIRALGTALAFVSSGPVGLLVGALGVAAGVLAGKFLFSLFQGKAAVDGFTQALNAAHAALDSFHQRATNLSAATDNLTASNHQVTAAQLQVKQTAKDAADAIREYGAKSLQAQQAENLHAQSLDMLKQTMRQHTQIVNEWRKANDQALEPLKKYGSVVNDSIDKTQRIRLAEEAAQKVLSAGMTKWQTLGDAIQAHNIHLTDAERGALRWATAGLAMSHDVDALKYVMSKAGGQVLEYAQGMRKLSDETHQLSVKYQSEGKPGAAAYAMQLSKTALAASALAMSTKKIPTKAKIKVEANKDYLDLLTLALGEKLPKAAATGSAKTSDEWGKGLKKLGPTTSSEVAKTGPLFGRAKGAAGAQGQATGTAWGRGVYAGIESQAGPIAAAMAGIMSAANSIAGAKKHGSGNWQSSIHEVGVPWVQGVITGITSRVSDLAQAMAGSLEQAIQISKYVAIGATIVGAGMAASIANGFVSKQQSVVEQVRSAELALFDNKGLIGEVDRIGRITGTESGKAIAAGIVGYQPTLQQQVRLALVQAMQQAMTSARQAVQTASGNLLSAFDSLASGILSAFDSINQAGATTGTFAGTAATRGLSGKALGEAQQLAAMQQQDQMNSLQNTLDQANQQLSQDQANGADAATIAKDQQAVADAQRQIDEAKLQQQITDDQAAADKAEKLDKDNLERRLAKLRAEIKAHPERAKKIRTEIDNLFKQFGITPQALTAATDFDTSASLFTAGMGDLKKSMDALTKATEELTKIESAAKAPPAPASPPSGGMGHKALGGFLPGTEGHGIPIMAHANEYVLRSQAARQIGLGTLNYMNATGRLPGFASGGPINPHTGGPDDKLSRASAMFANDWGIDKFQRDVATSLSGAAGPRAQILAALRPTQIKTSQGLVAVRVAGLRGNSWTNYASKQVAAWVKQFPNLTFEPGTPGQNIGYPGALARLPLDGGAFTGMMQSANDGVKSAMDDLARLTSFGVHGTGAAAPTPMPFDPTQLGAPGSPGNTGVPYGLENGGIVRRRPGGLLARIGEGRHDEAVVPLDGRNRLGGHTVNIEKLEVHDNVDVTRVETAIGRALYLAGFQVQP